MRRFCLAPVSRVPVAAAVADLWPVAQLRLMKIVHKRPAAVRRWLGTTVHCYVALSHIAAAVERGENLEALAKEATGDTSLSFQHSTFDAQEYKKAFDHMDKNKDGIIDVRELAKLLAHMHPDPKAGIAGAHKVLTAQEKAERIASLVNAPLPEDEAAQQTTAGLTFRDFLWLMAHRDRAVAAAEEVAGSAGGRIDRTVVQSFKALDVDNDGKVSVADIEKVFRALGTRLQQEEGWSHEEVEALVRSASKKGQDFLTLDEFATLLRKV